jgi:hypothetical protein
MRGQLCVWGRQDRERLCALSALRTEGTSCIFATRPHPTRQSFPHGGSGHRISEPGFLVADMAPLHSGIGRNSQRRINLQQSLRQSLRFFVSPASAQLAAAIRNAG